MSDPVRPLAVLFYAASRAADWPPLDLLHLNAVGYAALNQSLTPLPLNLAQTRASG
ncbi:MAG: hypothetical protein BroJett011_17180 [Chloroflexota bacterium]|nr:MAG: hypothetical protein BroJett011_17180 [Chloroflexota bacterium]